MYTTQLSNTIAGNVTLMYTAVPSPLSPMNRWTTRPAAATWRHRMQIPETSCAKITGQTRQTHNRWFTVQCVRTCREVGSWHKKQRPFVLIALSKVECKAKSQSRWWLLQSPRRHGLFYYRCIKLPNFYPNCQIFNHGLLPLYNWLHTFCIFFKIITWAKVKQRSQNKSKLWTINLCRNRPIVDV